MLQVMQVSTKACETMYSASICGNPPVTVRLWAIVGGQIALDFEHFGFSQRYSVRDQFTRDKWNGFHYAHQDREHPQGPQIGGVRSKRFHAPGQYFWLNIDVWVCGTARCVPVVGESKWWIGRVTADSQELRDYVKDEYWHRAARVLDAMSRDKFRLDKLTTVEWETYYALVKEGVERCK